MNRPSQRLLSTRLLPLRTSRRRHGAALLEFALIAVLFMTLLMGMMQFGIYLNATNTLWNLSREGARYAAVQRDDNPSANQMIEDHIKKDSPAGVRPPTVDPAKMVVEISPADYAQRAKGTEVKVTVTYDMSDKLFIPSVGNLLKKEYKTTTTMMVE